MIETRLYLNSEIIGYLETKHAIGHLMTAQREEILGAYNDCEPLWSSFRKPLKINDYDYWLVQLSNSLDLVHLPVFVLDVVE